MATIDPSADALSTSTSNSVTSLIDVSRKVTSVVSDDGAKSHTRPMPSKDDHWTTRGGLLTTTDGRNLFWSQDRYSVFLRLELFPQEKVLSVNINGILPYRDRFSATGSAKKSRIRCQASSGSDVGYLVLEGDLPHPVHLAEDEDDLDWCIERDKTGVMRDARFLLVTLYKAVPMQGLFVWWRRPLMEFPEVEQDDPNFAATGASNEFLKAWEEAHELFKQKKHKAHPDLYKEGVE